MLAVVIALLPTTLYGIYNFGTKAAVLIIVTVCSAVLTELIYELAMKKRVTIGDLSAVVTGLLLALNLPVSAPWWIGVVGSVFAILVVKMLFGGLGQNFMNPALGGRCFLMISFTSAMTNFSYISDWEAVSGATPLAILENGGAVNTMDMLIGRTGGTIGETSVIALMIGAIFLCAIGVIDARIPITYIVTLAVFVAIFGGHGLDVNYICAHICGGGVILGAFFMATDYVTSPITPAGKIIFGLCLGILTGIFRIFGPSAEGVSYAIIFCNLLVPLIERVTVPKAFGLEGGKK
jgi:RnfABCDGE-type electron transport complex D subunit